MTTLQSLLGIAAFILLAYAVSERRSAIPWRVVLVGLLLQLGLALIFVRFPLFKELFVALNKALLLLQQATQAGSQFVFGYLGGGELPFAENSPGAAFILAFQALPIILVISALSSLLFYWRILPWIVQQLSKLIKRLFNAGGALSLGAAANIFVGMVEAPLFIRPYLKSMTRAELFALMSCGMATIAGTVMVLYASILSTAVPGALGHILIASLISVPAALLFAFMLVPPDAGQTPDDARPQQEADSSMDAITRGTLQGVQLLINIIAMLIVLVALVTLVNSLLGLLPEIGGEALTLQRILGYIMAPVVWLIGIPWAEAQTAGSLMGTKVVLNEFLAYLDMSRLDNATFSERSKLIMTYALCGFANFGSLGIMLGGLTTMAPERRGEIVGLGMKSILSGVLATLMTGAFINLLV